MTIFTIKQSNYQVKKSKSASIHQHFRKQLKATLIRLVLFLIKFDIKSTEFNNILSSKTFVTVIRFEMSRGRKNMFFVKNLPLFFFLKHS